MKIKFRRYNIGFLGLVVQAIGRRVALNAISFSRNVCNNANMNIVGKIMVMSQLTTIKQAASKGWSEMIAKGGIPLLLAQMRALANKAAQKALQKAGKAGLENTVFREVLEQVGKKLSLKALGGKMIYGLGAIIGGFMDTAQMNKVLEYADVFYHKRFILEKETRINQLIGKDKKIIDIRLNEEDFVVNEYVDLRKEQIEILDKYNIDYIFKTKEELLVNIHSMFINDNNGNDETMEDFSDLKRLYDEIQ